MNKRAIIGLIVIAVLMRNVALFGQSKVGTAASPFLGISVGPRATAMGAAFVAVSADASCLYYNPGGIAQLPGSQFMISHTNWLVGSKLNWLGVVLKLDGDNTIGASFTQLNYGEDLVTTVLQPEGTGELWGASDIAAGVSYARNLTDRFSIGGTVKYIQQKVFNEQANAFAVDVGLLFVTQFNDMKLGMSISNFGTDLRFEGKDLLHRVDLDPDRLGDNETIVANLKTDHWTLPLFFRVGLAMDVIRSKYSRFTLAVDALRPSDNTEILNVGAEFAVNNMLYLRSGYKSLFRKESEEGLTLGAGLNFSYGPNVSLGVDYCFMDFGVFEAVHMFGMKIGF